MRRPKAQPVRKRSGKRTTGKEWFLNSESTLERDYMILFRDSEKLESKIKLMKKRNVHKYMSVLKKF